MQVRVVPVAETHHAAADELVAAPARATCGWRSTRAPSTLAKRIRDAELQKVPYVVVWGDRETREAMAVRRRGGGRLDALLSGSSGRSPSSRRRATEGSSCGFLLANKGGPAMFLACKAGAASPSPRRLRAARGSTRFRRGNAAAACSGVSTKKEDRLGLVNCLETAASSRGRDASRRPAGSDQRADPRAAGQARGRGRGADRDQGHQGGARACARSFSTSVGGGAGRPPVARVMDYGKWRYEQEQRARQARIAPVDDQYQGDQVPAEDRRPRLRGRRVTSSASSTSGRRSRSRSCSGAGEPPSGAGSDAPRASRRGRQGSTGQSSSSPHSTAGTW